MDKDGYTWGGIGGRFIGLMGFAFLFYFVFILPVLFFVLYIYMCVCIYIYIGRIYFVSSCKMCYSVVPFIYDNFIY